MGALQGLGEVFNELMNTVIDAQGFWEAISNQQPFMSEHW